MKTETAKSAEHSPRNVRYLTDRQVAEMTQIGLQTLRNHRFHGKGIPYRKLEKSVRYLESEVIQYMEAGRVDPANGGERGAE